MICFTDASYSPTHKLAVIGFIVNDEPMQLQQISVNGCAAAEKQTLNWCIDYCNNKFGNTNLIIYINN